MKDIEFKVIPKIYSPGGSLSFFELERDFEFVIKRIYYIYEFSKENKRGFHAHKELKQIMFCPHGAIEIEFDNGYEKKSILLDDPTKIVIVRAGYWREFTSLVEGSILCVAASDMYDEEDYIRDYKEYIKYLAQEYSLKKKDIEKKTMF